MKELLVLLASGCFFLTTAASPSIGFVKSNGSFRVDGSTIRGNSTLAEGNVVETTEARSVLQIGGVQIALLPDSRAKVFRDYAVFEKGAGVASSADKYVIQAAILRIAPATKDSVVQVEMRGATGVAVAARSGAASVRNAAGLLLASLSPGEALAFEPQTGAAEATKLSGVLTEKDGKFFLTDSTTKLTVELQGLDSVQWENGDGVPAHYVGQKLEITGSIIPGATAAAGASQVVHVVTVHVVTVRARHHVPPAGVVIGGVAVAGTVVGLAAAGTFSGGAASASVP